MSIIGACSGDFHFIEKVKGIKYLYASLDRQPEDYPMTLKITKDNYI